MVHTACHASVCSAMRVVKQKGNYLCVQRECRQARWLMLHVCSCVSSDYTSQLSLNHRLQEPACGCTACVLRRWYLVSVTVKIVAAPAVLSAALGVPGLQAPGAPSGHQLIK